MTLQNLIDLAKNRPELLSAQLAHPAPGPQTVWYGTVTDPVGHVWYDPVSHQLGLSGGGVPADRQDIEVLAPPEPT